MNRVWISAVVGLAVVVGVMLNTQQVLSADQASVARDGGPCGLFFQEGTVGGLGEITIQVENATKVMMICKGTGLANPTGVGQHFEGFTCGIVTPEGHVLVTEETQATVSAEGNGTMICTFRT